MKIHALACAALLATILLLLASPTFAQEAKKAGWEPKPDIVEAWYKRRAAGINFHEDKVPAYTLPDPLVFSDGRPVTTTKHWHDKRRPELMQLFRENIYGVRPDTPYEITHEKIGQRDNAFNIGATAQQIRATVKAHGRSHSFDFVLVVPQSDKPVPIVVLINNRYLIPLDKAVDENDPFWPVQTLVRRGYATASFHTSDVDPDKRDGYAKSIRALLDDPKSDPATRWRCISAWAWGASRVLDYALTQPQIDPKRTAVVGHSRGGKTALWAGAEDTRFSIAYSNNSGCGGAALSRRAFGETTARINKNFPHWFNGRFKSYDHKENDLPVDQHQLISLLAPRAVYVASADEDLWADPRGEYAALLAAGPVFKHLGLKHLTSPAMPPLDTPRHLGATGYHIRRGTHNLTAQDWGYFLDFADKQFSERE